MLFSPCIFSVLSYRVHAEEKRGCSNSAEDKTWATDEQDSSTNDASLNILMKSQLVSAETRRGRVSAGLQPGATFCACYRTRCTLFTEEGKSCQRWTADLSL